MTMKLALLLTWEILELLLLPVKITSLGTQIQKLFSLSSLSPTKFILFIGQMGCLDVAYIQAPIMMLSVGPFWIKSYFLPSRQITAYS